MWMLISSGLGGICNKKPNLNKNVKKDLVNLARFSYGSGFFQNGRNTVLVPLITILYYIYSMPPLTVGGSELNYVEV